jgi:hypothetical protein
MFWKLPLPLPQGDLAQLDELLARATGGAGEHAAHGSGFALHVLGMWLNFVISVGVVAFFLTRMAAALKESERELAAAREAALRNEQILSLGTLAAGAAHQLGTPLGDDGRRHPRTRTEPWRPRRAEGGPGCCCGNRSIVASRRFRRSSPRRARAATRACARWHSTPICTVCSTTGRVLRPRASAQRDPARCAAGAADRRRPHARAGAPQPARQRCRRQRCNPEALAFSATWDAAFAASRSSTVVPASMVNGAAPRRGVLQYQGRCSGGSARPRHRSVS